MQTSKDYSEFVIGGDYTFDFETYILVEYFQNTFVRKDSENRDLSDFMRALFSEVKASSRENFYVYIKHPVGELMNIGLQAMNSISDGSWALVPTLNYDIGIVFG